MVIVARGDGADGDMHHKMLVDLYGAPSPGFVNCESYHITSNAQIDLQGDRATVRSARRLKRVFGEWMTSEYQ